MIRPLPCPFIAGTKAREHKNCPPMLTSSTRSQSSSDMSTTRERGYKPALLIRMSTWSHRLSARSRRALTEASSATST